MDRCNYNSFQRNFVQLNYEKRLQIDTLLNQGFKQSYIARYLGVHRSTISREIKRGSTAILTYDFEYKTVYEPRPAQLLAIKRNLNSRKIPKYFGRPEILKKITRLVTKNHFSFEIIAGRLKFEKSPITFCHQTLYNYYHKGILKIASRFLPRYTFTNHAGKRTRHENISHKLIDLRPNAINERLESMHWEMDTVIGTRKTGNVLLVLTERMSRSELIFKLENRQTEKVLEKIDYLQSCCQGNFNRYFRSITVDNGTEFLDYRSIEKDNRTTVYYAHPYSSWERGSNENLNREIRRFFPKKTRFDQITEKQVLKVQNWMNNKPRKILGFMTSVERLKELCPEFLKLKII